MNLLLLIIIALHVSVSCKRNYLINLKLNAIMASQAQFDEALSRIDVATTNIAEDLRGLKDIIAGAGLPSDVEDQVLAKLENAATKLEAVAAETPEAGTEG